MRVVVLFLTAFAVVAGLPGAATVPARAIASAWTETPHRKVFQDDPRPDDAGTAVSWDAARNEHQSYQLLLRHQAAFTITSVAFTDLTGPGTIARANLNAKFQQYYDPTGGGRPEPDPLSNDSTIAVPANTTQGVWITVYVPKGQPAGQYAGNVTVNTTAGAAAFPIALTVYAVEIPDTVDGTYDAGTWSVFFNDYRDSNGSVLADDIAEQYGYQRYSAQWWTLVANAAREMKAMRQNQFHVSIDTLLDAGTRLQGDTYHFEWGIFDRFIETFLSTGAMRTIRGNPLLNAGPGGQTSSVWIIDGTGKVRLAPVGSEEAERWLDQYIPALKEHLDEKGWTAAWHQTISDEPANPDNYAATVAKYRHYFGSISTIQDAINGNSTEYLGSIDIWIPSVQEYSSATAPEWYAERQAAGDQVWSYTCGYCADPGDGWLDRMTTMPYYAAKEIAWGNYHFGLTGFFHWGYNAWAESGYGEPGGEARPGDGYIVYPDPAHNTVRGSVRGIATRDGIEDYELLRILGEKDPDTANRLAGSLVPAFDRFSDDVDLITRQSRELLAAAAT